MCQFTVLYTRGCFILFFGCLVFKYLFEHKMHKTIQYTHMHEPVVFAMMMKEKSIVCKQQFFNIHLILFVSSCFFLFFVCLFAHIHISYVCSYCSTKDIFPALMELFAIFVYYVSVFVWVHRDSRWFFSASGLCNSIF